MKDTPDPNETSVSILGTFLTSAIKPLEKYL